MHTIKEHIKKNEFSSVYLLYGQEDYLKLLYRDKLKGAIVAPEDTMNYSYFEGKDLDLTAVQSMADTVPFSAREDCLFWKIVDCSKGKNDFADYIKTMPETSIIVICGSMR